MNEKSDRSMRPASVWLMLLAACSAPAIVLPVPTHAVVRDGQAYTWLTWTPQAEEARLDAWSPVELEGTTRWIGSHVELTQRADGLLTS
jgi:hypothetical protein